MRAASSSEQAKALSLAPEGPGSLLRKGRRVVVDVQLERVTQASVDQMRAAGAEVVNVSHRYETITVATRPEDLGDLAAVA